MQVILLKDVDKLGKAGDIVKVKPGFGRNYLIPRDMAVEATKKSAKFLENEKKKLGAKSKRLKGEAEKIKEKLENISCTIPMSTGEDEKLFGEVTPEAISSFYKQEGLDVDKRKIYLEKPIRHLGVYQVEVKLYPDVSASVKVWVVKK